MTTRTLLAIAAIAGAGVAAYAAAPQAGPAARPDAAVTRAVANPARSAANRARDAWRHPAQTLAFFGVTPAKKVVEFIPGGGWYSEILAAIPAKGGGYTALVTPRSAEATKKMLAEKKLTATVATLDGATGASTVPANSQDVVLTFRNIHNLTMGGGATAGNAFKAWFAMLKKGGTLGIVEHRLPESADVAMEAKSGYLKTSTVVKLAEAAGFRPAGASEVNANPKDTHDHPEGVWTLPPTYRLGDVDRAKYAAIGESDRMTLRFVKP